MDVDERPEYILRARDAEIVPKKGYGPVRMLRTCVIAVGGVLLAASFLSFIDAPETSWTARALLICLITGSLFVNTDERVPVPFEIWFYPDRLIIYHGTHYHSRKVIRREYDMFYYKDVRQCQFRRKAQRFNIYGVVEGLWYDYGADGHVQAEPSYHKTTDSIRYFYTMFDDGDRILREIEAHSPLRVDVDST